MAELWLFWCILLAASTFDYNALASANSGSSPAPPLTISSTQPSGTLSTEVPPSVVKNKSLAASSRDFECPDGVKCRDLGASCIRCDFNDSCIYGQVVEVQCTSIDGVECTGPHTFNRIFNCRYCYQTSPESYQCEKKTGCKVVSSPRDRYRTNCTVREDVLCLGEDTYCSPAGGNRTFPKLLFCNWTSGYRWSTAVLLSLTLGGFGVDRFYLGHWKEGLGKLFSFGGLGAWTLVDLILIAIGYVGPEDGSLYIF